MRIHFFSVDQPIIFDIQNQFPLLSIVGADETVFSPRHLRVGTRSGSLFLPVWPEQDKLITLIFFITGSSYVDFLNKLRQFENTFRSLYQTQSQVLYFQRFYSSTVSRAFGSITKVSIVEKEGLSAKGIVQFRKTLPGFYTALARATQLFSIPASSSTTSFTYTYNGTYPEYPKIRITGPIANNTVFSFPLGIQFTTSSLSSAETLVINFSPYDALSNPNITTISLPNKIISNVLRVPEIRILPGNNTITVSAQPTGGGTIQIGTYPVDVSIY